MLSKQCPAESSVKEEKMKDRVQLFSLIPEQVRSAHRGSCVLEAGWRGGPELSAGQAKKYVYPVSLRAACRRLEEYRNVIQFCYILLSDLSVIRMGRDRFLRFDQDDSIENGAGLQEMTGGISEKRKTPCCNPYRYRRRIRYAGRKNKQGDKAGENVLDS